MATYTRYAGDERRHHKIFVTKNTEYHVRKGVVVGVRPRGAKDWHPDHSAVAMRVEGFVLQGTFLPQPGAPKPGQRLYLATQDNDVVTSPVVAIVRPPKATVAEYPASLRSGPRGRGNGAPCSGCSSSPRSWRG